MRPVSSPRARASPASLRAVRHGAGSALRASAGSRRPGPCPASRCTGRTGRLELPQAQEAQQALVLLSGCREECLAADDVHLGTGEQGEDRLKLLGVLAAVAIGMMTVREALVGRVPAHPADLAFEALVFQLQGLLERFPLITPRDLMLIGGEGALDGVADHHHELHRGKVAGDPLHRERMVDVIATGLEGGWLAVPPGSPPGDLGDGEVTPVPAQAAVVVQVEIVDAFVECGPHYLGMGHQCPEQGRGAASLGPDEDE